MTKRPFLKILELAGYAACSLLSLVTILSAYGGMVNPKTSTIPAILAMTFPIWLLLTGICLITLLFINRRMAIIPGATLLLCISPILNFCPMNIGKDKLTAEEEAESFTIMSYNVYGLNDYRSGWYDTDPTGLYQEVEDGRSNPTLSHILKSGADIVCIQELYRSIKADSKTITNKLCDSINSAYPYYISSNGNSILSKYPLKGIDFTYAGGFYTSYLAAVADIKGHSTLIVCVHFESIGLNDNDKELYRELTDGEGGRQALSSAKHQLLSKLSEAFRNRAQQTGLLRERLDNSDFENVIIAGDFNDISNCYAIRRLARDDFKSAFSEAGFGPIITYHANRFYFHIDHILYRGQLKAVDFQKDDFDRSDHYPIMAKFIWTDN